LAYDRHRNPATIKGVLFDTNRAYREEAVWEMMERSRVAAYGDIKEDVKYLLPKDIVFFCHRGVGLIAAGEVVGPVQQEGTDEAYRGGRFLTRVPSREEGLQRFMPAAEVSRITGQFAGGFAKHERGRADE
jgi:hypothetical protein